MFASSSLDRIPELRYFRPRGEAMAMTVEQLEELRKAWSAKVTKQIDTFQEGADTLRMHIEAEKVSLLYEIAIQLAESLASKRHLAAYPPRKK
jgi:hypothetical protein